jgi:CTP synthase (UTP-ammonia lyase)
MSVMRAFRVGLVGDYDAQVTAHQAIPRALQIASGVLGCAIEEAWLPTAELAEGRAADLSGFDGLWAVPATPYRSTEGALGAIRYAREQHLPFLGTCGGFQHVVLEYARNALGHRDADHGELDPSTSVPLIAPLSCSMVEVDGKVHFTANSQIARIYGCSSATERYHCRYGMNPAYVAWFDNSPLTVTSVDDAGEPRAVELAGHRFFIGTAFQPERSALAGRPHPLVVAFAGALAQ